MNDPRPITLLIGALGGQGGGVLTNWLVEAARLAGYPAQATSIPGVAQRTGATTYYIEIFPKKNPPVDPIFCLFPSSGDVDIVVALEPTEAGRALEGGFVTGKTTMITSTQRVYSTAEKSVAGDGGLDAAPILQGLARVAKTLVQINPAKNGESGQINALIFGALIASGVLPFTEDEARHAIESAGLAVAANLTGFDAGLPLARQQNGEFPHATEVVYDAAPNGFEHELNALPEALRPLIGHALTRLVDYQDGIYARKYLARLTPILALDIPPYHLTSEVAQRLAAWMSHEDVIRVAQLKTRKGRLTRIRQEVGVQSGEPVQITDFLSPGQAELAGVLPATIARLFMNGNGKKSSNLHLSWPTSFPLGYAALKFLASLRKVRPHTLVYFQEQSAIDTWLEAVRLSAEVEYAFACQVAELAVWARGYGDVRERGFSCLEKIFENWRQRLEENPETVKIQVQASHKAARNDPDHTCNYIHREG